MGLRWALGLREPRREGRHLDREASSGSWSPILVKVFSGNSNPSLAKAICDAIGIPLGRSTVKPFPNGETFVKIEENVRGTDVFVIQSTSYPANDNLMELLICIDALKRASARRITAVMPYFGYARQDRKTGGRTPSPPSWWPT